jgi:hypothetical protein
MKPDSPSVVAREHDRELHRALCSTYGVQVANVLLYELAVDEDRQRSAAAEAVIRATAGGPCAQTFLRRALAEFGRAARSRVRKKLGQDYFPA